MAWSDILRVQNPNLIDERVLPAVTVRMVRIAVYQLSATGENPNVLPAVAELEIYRRPDRPATGCAPVVYAPPLDRKQWRATSSNGPAQGAVSSPTQGWIDPAGTFNGPDTWLDKTGLVPGAFVHVDLGGPQTFDQLVLVADHVGIRNYQIFVSDDGATWGDPIAAGALMPAGGYDYWPINLPRQTRSHIKIVSQDDSHGFWWGFHNISLLDSTKGAGADLGDDVDVARGKPITGSTGKNAGAAFDGDLATGVNDGGVLAVDLGAPYAIARTDVTFGATVDGFVFRVETSGDGAAWTLRQTVYVSAISARPMLQRVLANYTARFLRFKFAPAHPHNVDVQQDVREIAVYRSSGTQVVGRERP
jgi:hypothetical protein